MKLRPRQQRMLEFIEEYLDEHDYPPTIREIGKAAGISSTSVVNYNLERLEAMGFIERNREVSRGLRLVGYKEKRREMIAEGNRVPLYGEIAAGEPIPMPASPEDVLEYVRVPSELMPKSGEAFALRVKGHSMIDALVDTGDIIIVRSQSTVENHEMAAVEIMEPHERAGATLKFFHLPERGDPEATALVELRPANPDPAYQSFWVPADQVKVYGKVVSVLRRYP
ncbi:MAG: repressor LexA [Chloroflexi bacterium]|nr:repressor LexA [Chloroflexota bacterium]